MSGFCAATIENARQLRVKGTGNYWDGVYDRVRYVRENGQPTFEQRGNPEGAIKYLSGTWWLLARGLKCLHWSKRSGKWFSVRTRAEKRNVQVTVKSKMPQKAKYLDVGKKHTCSLPTLFPSINSPSATRRRSPTKTTKARSDIHNLRTELNVTLGHLDSRDDEITKLREKISALEIELAHLRKRHVGKGTSGNNKLSPIEADITTQQSIKLRLNEDTKKLKESQEMASSLKLKISMIKAINRRQMEEIKTLRASNEEYMQSGLKEKVSALENEILKYREQNDTHWMEVQSMRDVISQKKRGMNRLNAELETQTKLVKLTAYERDVLIAKNSAQYTLIEKLKLQNSDLRKKIKLSVKAWKNRLMDGEK